MEAKTYDRVNGILRWVGGIVWVFAGVLGYFLRTNFEDIKHELKDHDSRLEAINEAARGADNLANATRENQKSDNADIRALRARFHDEIERARAEHKQFETDIKHLESQVSRLWQLRSPNGSSQR